MRSIANVFCHSGRRCHFRWTALLSAALIASLFAVAALAQEPVAALPQVFIDTTWNLPTGGTTWAAHTSAQLSSALTASSPGDVIVLDAGVVYSGRFYLPAKSNPNNKWIYVISSQLSNLPAGTRVTPDSAPNMPKLVTPNTGSALYVHSGANYWRFAGIEIYSASTYRPPSYPTGHYYGGALVQNLDSVPAVLPDSFTFDRCYLHGDPNHDLQRALAANWSNTALIDSWISEIHAIGGEVQAFESWWSPGPFKITNNHLEAATENVMFGGAGGPANPYLPSDIQIQFNDLYKPLAWVNESVQQGLMVIKDAFELKSAQRVLFDSNTIENVWVNGQVGFAVQLTVRSGQSGDIAVVEDVTVTNNILTNVVSGFNTLYKDNTCGKAGGYPNCHNAGNVDRIVIKNNLVTYFDPTAVGGGRNTGLQLAAGVDAVSGPTPVPGVPQDTVFQHNTLVPNPNGICFSPVLFADNKVTNNIWILDNALCRQVPGPAGQPEIAVVMNNPSTPPYDLTQRFYGNVMFVPVGDKLLTFPAHNDTTTVPFTYLDPTHGNYQLLTPYWTDTSDGKIAGVQNASLPSSGPGSGLGPGDVGP